MTEEEIRECGKSWQLVLGLTDWEIVWKKCRREDFDSREQQGEVKYCSDIKQAIIKIMDEIDWDNPDFTQDQEKVVVHELLHLKFHLLDKVKGEIWDLIIHQYVEELAKSYVATKRKWGDSDVT